MSKQELKKVSESKLCFGSDYHFGHANVVVYCNRPVEPKQGPLDEWIITQHNSVVNPQDIFYFNGDLTMYRERDYDKIAGLVSRLNGKEKHFNLGNHDKLEVIKRLYQDKLITSYCDYRELEIDGIKVVMSHYPMFEWNKGHHGSFMLHGHCHGSRKFYPFPGKIMDIGLDAHPQKRPYVFKEIYENLRDKPIAYHPENK